MKHCINILDYTSEELESVIALARRLKKRRASGIADNLMSGRTLGMYFQKPSLRTRVSLEVAMNSMGGSAICLEIGARPFAERESVADQARVMSRYVDAISIRTFDHAVVEELATWSTVPVINALSDWSHPTQALADVMTMREHLGDTTGKTLAYVGDGNNVARSLAAICARLGMRFVCSGPEGYALTDSFLASLNEKCPGATVEQIHDPQEAVAGASAVYTDVWASMGQEDEAEARKAIFQPYQLNAALMAAAAEEAVVLHCLPAHRGEEITDEMMESPRSAVFDQAENRMHIYRALFAGLIAGEGALNAR